MRNSNVSKKKQGPNFNTLLQQKKSNPDNKLNLKNYIPPSQVIDEARKTVYSFRFKDAKDKTICKNNQQEELQSMKYEAKKIDQKEVNPYTKLGPIRSQSLKMEDQNISYSKIKLQSINQMNVVVSSKVRFNEKGQSQIKSVVQNQGDILITQKPEDTMWVLDRIQAENTAVALILSEQILNKEQTPQQKKEDQELNQSYQAYIKQTPNPKDTIPIIMVALKKSYKNDGVNIRFSQKSSTKTQISMNHLVTGFLKQLAKCTQKLEQSERDRFKGIDSDKQKYLDFLKWYKRSIKQRMGIQEHNIIIHKINCFRCQVNWSSSQTQKVRQAARKAPNRIRLHPMFQNLSLSPLDFDQKGDFKFPSQKNYIQYRGSWPYYQPTNCNGYGLRVIDKYDHGDNTWLQMKNQKNEWTVAFHGTKSNYIPEILKGMDKGQALKPGQRQAYHKSKALNKQGALIGVGVYCTPHIQTALEYTYGVPVGDKKYHVVFQCRVNPRNIQVCSNNIYWVIGQSKDIRPYRVILVEDSVKNEYPRIQQQFGEIFKFEKYKQKIDKALQKYD